MKHTLTKKTRDDNMKIVSFYIPIELARRFKLKAVEANRSQAELFRQAVELFVDNVKIEEPQ